MAKFHLMMQSKKAIMLPLMNSDVGELKLEDSAPAAGARGSSEGEAKQDGDDHRRQVAT